MGSIKDIASQAFIRRCIECKGIYGYTIDGKKTECDTSSNTCLQLCLAGVEDSHGLCEGCLCSLRTQFKKMHSPAVAQQCA
jgi:hypothetical protein